MERLFDDAARAADKSVGAANADSAPQRRSALDAAPVATVRGVN
jgi:hypothetical protein